VHSEFFSFGDLMRAFWVGLGLMKYVLIFGSEALPGALPRPFLRYGSLSEIPFASSNSGRETAVGASPVRGADAQSAPLPNSRNSACFPQTPLSPGSDKKLKRSVSWADLESAPTSLVASPVRTAQNDGELMPFYVVVRDSGGAKGDGFDDELKSATAYFQRLSVLIRRHKQRDSDDDLRRATAYFQGLALKREMIQARGQKQ
jgi:hypothetical protein